MMSGAGGQEGKEEVPVELWLQAWTVWAGSALLNKHSSCLTHSVSDKTFVRKMFLFLAKKKKKKS